MFARSWQLSAAFICFQMLLSFTLPKSLSNQRSAGMSLSQGNYQIRGASLDPCAACGRWRRGVGEGWETLEGGRGRLGSGGGEKFTLPSIIGGCIREMNIIFDVLF